MAPVVAVDTLVARAVEVPFVALVEVAEAVHSAVTALSVVALDVEAGPLAASVGRDLCIMHLRLLRLRQDRTDHIGIRWCVT